MSSKCLTRVNGISTRMSLTKGRMDHRLCRSIWNGLAGDDPIAMVIFTHLKGADYGLAAYTCEADATNQKPGTSSFLYTTS